MNVSQENEPEYIELAVQPIPPDTVSSVRAELLPLIEDALHRAGKESLLTEGQVRIEVEQTFPTDEVIVIGFTLLSGIALETYKTIVLPALKKRFRTRQKRRRKGRSKK